MAIPRSSSSATYTRATPNRRVILATGIGLSRPKTLAMPSATPTETAGIPTYSTK